MTAIFVLVLLLLAEDGPRVHTVAFPALEQCESAAKSVQKKVPKAKTACVKVEL